MSDFHQAITKAIEGQLEELRSQLVDAGLDEEKVSTVFQNFTSAPRAKNTRKYGMVHVVLNYGKSHAVFGDFMNSLCHIKDEYFNKLPWIRYSRNLAYGPGWNLLNVDKLPALEAIFKEEGVEYVKMKRDEFDTKFRKGKMKTSRSEPEDPKEDSDSEDSEEEDSKDSDSEEENSKEDPDSEEEDSKDSKEDSDSEEDSEEQGSSGGSSPSESSPPRKSKAKKVKRNKWKNLEDRENDTGFIFIKIPSFPKGKDWIVVGTQDKKAGLSAKGLESVITLDSEEEARCGNEFFWDYLTEDIVRKVRKEGDKKLAKQLQEILDQDLADSDSEGSDSEGGGGPVYYQFVVPYKDKKKETGSVKVVAQFESQVHFDLLEGDSFETMGNLFNDYLGECYEERLWLAGQVKVKKKLSGKPEDDDLIVVKRE